MYTIKLISENPDEAKIIEVRNSFLTAHRSYAELVEDVTDSYGYLMGETTKVILLDHRNEIIESYERSLR